MTTIKRNYVVRITIIIVIMASVLFTGCKKNQTTPETPTVETTEVETTEVETTEVETTVPSVSLHEYMEKTFETEDLEGFYVLQWDVEKEEVEIKMHVVEQGKASGKIKLEEGKQIALYIPEGISDLKSRGEISIIDSTRFYETHLEIFFTEFYGERNVTLETGGYEISLTVTGILQEEIFDNTNNDPKVPTGLSYAEWSDSTKFTSPIVNWDEELGIGTLIEDGSSIHLADIKQLLFAWGSASYGNREIVSTEYLSVDESCMDYGFDQKLILDESKITQETEITVKYNNNQTMTFIIIP